MYIHYMYRLEASACKNRHVKQQVIDSVIETGIGFSTTFSLMIAKSLHRE